MCLHYLKLVDHESWDGCGCWRWPLVLEMAVGAEDGRGYIETVRHALWKVVMYNAARNSAI